MHGALLAIGLLTVLLSAAMTWAVTWRYGRSRAMIVPFLALVSVAVLLWRATGMEAHQAMGMIAVAVILAAAAVAGALVGALLARWRGR